MILGTIVMTCLAVFVAYVTLMITNFKRYAKKRDEYYMERIDGLELIIKKEFQNILINIKQKL